MAEGDRVLKAYMGQDLEISVFEYQKIDIYIYSKISPFDYIGTVASGDPAQPRDASTGTEGRVRSGPRH